LYGEVSYGFYMCRTLSVKAQACRLVEIITQAGVEQLADAESDSANSRH
jgi:hypothetical protein